MEEKSFIVAWKNKIFEWDLGLCVSYSLEKKLLGGLHKCENDENF